MTEQDLPGRNNLGNVRQSRIFPAEGELWTLTEGPEGSHLINVSGTREGSGVDTSSVLWAVFDVSVRRKIEAQLNEEEANQQDVPAHEGGLTSSVGGFWPPERASFERIKGIYTPGIVRSSDSLNHITGEIEKAREIFDGEVSRVSLRAVVDVDFLKVAARSESFRPLIEAVIPLNGTQAAFENTALVYFGLNHSTRQPIQKELERYMDNLGEASSHVILTPREIRRRAEEKGYDIKILSKQAVTEECVEQVALLYGRFGWTRNEVSTILHNTNNIIGIAVKDGSIVSAGIAEMARIPIGGNNLRIVEITEAATLDEHAKNGLYTAVSSGLLEELSKRSRSGGVLDGEADLIYGECNGNALGVLKTAHIQGRRFAKDAGSELGFSDSGVLPQHVPIAGLPIDTPYNDLFPAFMTREDLYRIYSK